MLHVVLSVLAKEYILGAVMAQGEGSGSVKALEFFLRLRGDAACRVNGVGFKTRGIALRAGLGVREGNHQIGGQTRGKEGELGSAAVVQFLCATDHELSLEQSMRILKYLLSTRA